MDRISLGTRKVSIEFPGVKALNQVDFEVSTGEIRAVVGANGAGKSTLMKVLAGANPEYTGEVCRNGKGCGTADAAVGQAAGHTDRISGGGYRFGSHFLGRGKCHAQ